MTNKEKMQETFPGMWNKEKSVAEWKEWFQKEYKEPISDKYEYHTDHTDCIWYGSDSGCPVTCSQYRDGWNDAMEYVFKDGKGYQPYRRDMTKEEAIKILKYNSNVIHKTMTGETDPNEVEALDMAIKALEQESRWIPVSAKLPEKTGWYLITFKVYRGDYAVCQMCYRRPENYWARDDISKKVFDNDEVVAWMPLPQPYRKVEEC